MACVRGWRDDVVMLQAGALTPHASTRLTVRALSIPLALLAMMALLLPVMAAGPSHLTSDESLYVAEAYNIAEGKGLTYPSGEAITHRAPAYPLLLAPAVKMAGPDGAYTVTKVAIAVNAALVFVLAWRLGGQIAAWTAGLAAAASAYLSELGTTLYLDPAQCTFLLLCALALHTALSSGSSRWYAMAGFSLGVAFLIKESAVQWAPAAVVATLALPCARSRAGLTGALVFSAAFAATVAPWWIWVYAQTSQLFLLGEPQRLAVEGLAATIVAAAGAVTLRRWRPSPRVALPAAIAITAAWGVFLVYGLAAFSSWPSSGDYVTTVPRYLVRVAPQMQPYFLILGAWGWIGVRAARGDEPARLLAVLAALFAPFAIVAADRWLQLRDALPLVYLSYVALGVAAAGAWPIVRRMVEGSGAMPILAVVAVIAAAGFAAHEAAVFRGTTGRESRARAESGSWDSPYTRGVAAWMTDTIPAGSNVLMSRLYFSSIHVETDGRYRIQQLPTVRVDINTADGSLLAARSNLFRWGESDLRKTEPGDTWLYLQQFPQKEYWVGLSEQELLTYVAEREIDYLVLTGEDVAFSSNTYAWYFTANPAFTLMASQAGTGGDRMFAYSIDRSRLRPMDHSTAMTPRGFQALEEETGMSASQISARLGTPIYVAEGDGGLSDRELAAALEGREPGDAD